MWPSSAADAILCRVVFSITLVKYQLSKIDRVHCLPNDLNKGCHMSTNGFAAENANNLLAGAAMPARAINGVAVVGA